MFETVQIQFRIEKSFEESQCLRKIVKSRRTKKCYTILRGTRGGGDTRGQILYEVKFQCPPNELVSSAKLFTG